MDLRCRLHDLVLLEMLESRMSWVEYRWKIFCVLSGLMYWRFCPFQCPTFFQFYCISVPLFYFCTIFFFFFWLTRWNASDPKKQNWLCCITKSSFLPPALFWSLFCSLSSPLPQYDSRWWLCLVMSPWCHSFHYFLFALCARVICAVWSLICAV